MWRGALRLEVDEVAAVVAEVGPDREHEPPDGEHERRDGGGGEGEQRPVPERVSPGIGVEPRAGPGLERGERAALERRLDARVLAVRDVEPELRDRCGAGSARVHGGGQRAEVGHDRVADRPGDAVDDRRDLHGDRLASDEERQRAADAAGERAEPTRDDGPRRCAVGGLRWADESLSLRGDRVAHADRAALAVRHRDAALAEPPCERDALHADRCRAAQRGAPVGAALDDARRDEDEVDEATAPGRCGQHRPEHLRVVGVRVAEVDAAEHAVGAPDDGAIRDEAGADGEHERAPERRPAERGGAPGLDRADERSSARSPVAPPQRHRRERRRLHAKHGDARDRG